MSSYPWSTFFALFVLIQTDRFFSLRLPRILPKNTQQPTQKGLRIISLADYMKEKIVCQGKSTTRIASN